MNALRPLKIEGTIQHYAWGGYDLLAELLGKTPKQANEPWAELWLGAHPKGPAQLEKGNLFEYISQNPLATLGEEKAGNFEGNLPFLLKILDVREMLSIQLHPEKLAAERGFAKEEALGIDRLAPNRNYRDRNHKPELGVALTDFYLLHGFRSAAEIKQTLHEVPGWKSLLPFLEDGGVKALYRHVMESDQKLIDAYLKPLHAALNNAQIDKTAPDFWAKRAFEQYTVNGHFDRGIFSIYWFNVVHLQPGEGIFQGAGIPHAYLEGSCIELMANSDNVLRGGLTVKHIDVPELLANLRLEPIVPEKLRLQRSRASQWKQFLTPAPDFTLSQLDLPAGEAITERIGPAVYLVLEGAVSINDDHQSRVEQGQAIFLPHGVSLSLKAEAQSLIYRAT